MGGRRVTATEARIRLGELMRRAMEDQEPVFIERGGKPVVVVMSLDNYERLVSAGAGVPRADALGRLARLRKEVRRRTKGKALPDVVEVIRKTREDEDERLLGSLRSCQPDNAPDRWRSG